MSAMSDMIREQFGAGDAIRDAGVPDPAGVERFDDIAYGPDAKWQSLDVYRPEGTAASDGMPVIVSVHGGGWVYGDKELYHLYCMDLARRGFVVVNFTYRLAPEFKFPASMEDTCAVFNWTVDHIAEYGGDPEKVFAVGDSAGAHMLGLFCGMCTEEAYREAFDFAPPAGFKPLAVALNCGAYEIHVSDDPTDLTSGLMGDFLPNGGDERELGLINVIRHTNADFPPTYLMTCDGDFLHDGVYAMDAKLGELKVMHEVHIFAGKEEPLGHVFHLNMQPTATDAARCNDDEAAFFRRFL